MENLKVYQLFLIFILFFITLCIYIPMLNAGYSPTDDWLMLKSYSGALKSISFDYIINTFKNYHEGLYHPLVTLSYSLEVMIFGFVPAVFHFDNILLHIINIWLVFLIFFKLSKNNYWVGFIVAALFALHPTRVESVAWISARKDLLYAPSYLLSILFYLKHNEFVASQFVQPQSGVIPDYDPGSLRSSVSNFQIFRRSLYIKKFFILSIFFFLLSCFSKSMAITLPFVLILIDRYTNNFDKKEITRYIPYFIVAIVFIVITFLAHYNTEIFAANERLQITFFKTAVNFINAHFNILFYLDKFFLPINLYCMYPLFYNEFASMPPWFIMYSPAVLYSLILFVFLLFKKYKIKLVLFGFLFFLISIMPVCGVFPIGDFAVADRYTYIPYLGLFFIFAKIIVRLFGNVSYNNAKLFYGIVASVKIFLIVFICIVIGTTLGWLSYKRVFEWKYNHYGAPIKMEYYEFGIKKKTEELSKISHGIRKEKRTYKTPEDRIIKRYR